MDGAIGHVVGDGCISIRGPVSRLIKELDFFQTQRITDMNTNTDMNTIDDLMAALTVGSPARHRNLSVYPLRSEGKGATAAYLVLDDALATGRFRITEVSESGSVPRLLAINDNGSPVFLLDGEELVGAKQNRVLNLSMMLAPKSRTEIPVSCVEAGRWRTESHAFRAAQRVQFAGGRAKKMDQVSRSL